MTISTETYETIFQDYSHAMAWLESIGVNLGNGRTLHYEKVIRYWKDNYSIASDDEAEKSFPDFVSSMYEIHEFIGIYEAFRNIPASKLTFIAEKLQKAVNGPIRASDESPKSTAARNFLFEVVMAARAHRPTNGITAILDASSDTGISFNRRKIWIECKRVTNPDGIEKNVRKASNQLEKVLNSKIGAGHRGLVALDVSKIFNQGDKLLVQKNDDELTRTIAELTYKFLDQHSPTWQKVISRKSRKIIGLIARTSYMATSEDRNLLVHVSEYGVSPRNGSDTSDGGLLKDISDTLRGQV